MTSWPLAPGRGSPGGVPALAWRHPAGWRTVFFAAIYVVSAAICCALAAGGKAQFTDLHVYRLGGEAALHDTGLYSLRFHGLPFTYPPFPAVLFAAIAALPWGVAVALVTLGSAIALPVMLYLALRLPQLASPFSQRDAWRLALAMAAVAIWLEPVRTTLGYGQVDVFLAAAVLYDLNLPANSRRKGIAIGVAAGIKLTPAIFVPYLLVTRQYRAAATATAAFAATVAVGFAVMPASSAHYWDGTFLNPGHISPVQNTENQSLMGALARTLHTPNVGQLWLPVAIALAVAGLGLARSAQRRGDEAVGFCLCAITGLLISPISWTHHWVIAVPGLLIAAVAIYKGRIRKPLARRLSIAALTALSVICWLGLTRMVPGGTNWLHLPPLGIVDSELYVIAGLVALAIATYGVLARHLASRSPDPGNSTIANPDSSLGNPEGAALSSR
jgi:alpha-1,2-mannosyltransferase